MKDILIYFLEWQNPFNGWAWMFDWGIAQGSLNSGLSVYPYMATEKGDVCFFPFFFAGRSHMSCVEFGSDRPWCATANLQIDPNAWDYCTKSK